MGKKEKRRKIKTKQGYKKIFVKKACVRRRYKATLTHDAINLGIQAEVFRKPL